MAYTDDISLCGKEKETLILGTLDKASGELRIS